MEARNRRLAITNLTYLDTYVAVGNREDLINVVQRISPEATVFKSRIGGISAKARLHEWQTQALAASNSGNAVVEGSAAAFASGDITARTRRGNYTQILRKSFSVSYTQEATDIAGVANEYDEQRDLKTAELMKDLNISLLQQTSASGDSATARTMNGALAATTTNAIAAATNEKLTQPAFNRLLRLIWQNSGRAPNAVYVRGYNKQAISGWTVPNERTIDAAGKTVVASFDKYDSDFGKVIILPENDMPDAQLLTISEEFWNVAYLRPLDYKEIGEDGGSMRGRVEVEATLEFRAENSGGKITNLTFES